MTATPVSAFFRWLFHLARPRWPAAAAAFACMAVLGATTGLYAFLMGPALRFLLSGGADGLERVRWLLGESLAVDRSRALIALPAVIVAVGVVKGFAYLGQFFFMGLFSQRVAADLRQAAFAALARLSPARVPSQRAGDLLTRLTQDVSQIETATFYTLGAYVRDSLQIVILVGVALLLNWKVALGALFLLPVAILPAARLTRSVMKRLRVGQTRMGLLAAQLSEALVGLRTIQAFNGQPAERARFEENATLQRKAFTRAGWTRAAVPAVMEILAAGGIAATLAAAISTQAVPPAELVSVLTALILIYQPAKDLGRVTQYAVQAAVSGERVGALLGAPPAVTERPGARPAPPLAREVLIDGVCFRYGDRPALECVQLRLPVGEVTAVVGQSGSGKSTLATLLLRFEAPQQGTIRLDGTDVAELTVASVRAQFAYVSQDAQLFAATVRENLRLGRPEATDEELRQAAQITGADAFIQALPAGYDTVLGERGLSLSGGQRQRLALARALVSRAPVLILDEATSNLDPASEREVQAALQAVLPGRTALVIAHRLATIEKADRIHVLSSGAVVESGTHAELLARGGDYARLWRLQHNPEGAAA